MSGSRPVRTPSGVINVEPVNAPLRRGTVVRLRSIDTWSVMRTGFLLSMSIAVVIVVAVAVLWLLFSATGVFDAIGRTGDNIIGTTTNPHPVEVWLTFPRLMVITLIVAVIEVILTTAALTLLASLYNVASSMVGGVEATLSEDR